VAEAGRRPASRPVADSRGRAESRAALAVALPIQWTGAEKDDLSEAYPPAHRSICYKKERRERF
jgi:hypothetical protein